MHNAFLVGGVQGGANGFNNGQYFLRRKAFLLLHHLTQRFTWHILHSQVDDAFLFPHFVDAHDIGMIQLRSHLCFLPKTLQEDRVPSEFAM